MYASTGIGPLVVLISALFVSYKAIAEQNVVGRPDPTAPAPAEAPGEAKSRFPIISDPKYLPPNTQKALGLKLDGTPDPAAAGDAGHPFTTMEASAENEITPVDKFPWRAAGKLLMTFQGGKYVCSASIIGKGLLVTAAHCVHEFGKRDNGWALAISFEPARHGTTRPYGTWTAKEWWISKAYFDGTDRCTQPGVVCENDIAVIVLDKSGGKFIGDLVGRYGFKSDSYGYFDFLGKKAGQITQLGYPQANYDGSKMLRTDSIGYWDEPSNVIIGSAQTGGSSGCAWIMNFGTKPSAYVGPVPIAADPNQVIATTSWGYNSGTMMIQGASRFSRNSIYTTKSNIQSLVDSACAANPGYCD